jgi:hypothetical protein
MILLLLACAPTAKDSDSGSPGTTDSGTTGTTDSGTTDSGTDPGTTAGLPDPRDQMVRDAHDCQEVQGTPQAGGTVYYWGEYLGDSTNGWQGREILYYFANDTAKGAGLSDCTVAWTSTAVSASPGRCKECSVAMAVTGVGDAGGTTCDPALFDQSDFATTYALKLPGDGTAQWFYADSGDAFAAGYTDATGANFLSASTCAWF